MDPRIWIRTKISWIRNIALRHSSFSFHKKLKNNSLGVELFLELPCLHAEEVHLARVTAADQMLPQKPKEYLLVLTEEASEPTSQGRLRIHPDQ
jgi:hypothetical protein